MYKIRISIKKINIHDSKCEQINTKKKILNVSAKISMKGK